MAKTPKNPYSFDGFDIESLESPTQEKVGNFTFNSPQQTDYPQLYELIDDTGESPKFNIDEAFDDGINLNAFLEEPKETVNDLRWLTHPDVKEIPTETAHIRDELHRQWVDKKPYKRLDYSEHHKESPKPELPKLSLRTVLQKAVRMASDGIPHSVIYEYLNPISSMDAVQKTISIINREKDVLGRLFIRASVYPGCHKGEWKDKVRSCNNSARYIISAKKCRGCYQNRGGRCDIFKKEIVDLLPWSKALAWYQPIFEEHGINAVGNTVEEKVISMFRAVPSTPKTPENYFPVDYLPTVPLEQAVDEIVSYKDKRKVIDISYRNEMKEYENAVSYLDNLKRCMLITPKDYENILRSTDSPITIMLKARDVLLKTKEVGLYSGPGMDVLLNQFGDVSEEEMLAYLANIDNKQIILDNSHKIIQENKRRAVDQINKWVQNRMLTPEQGKSILALDLSPTDIILLGKNTILSKGDTPTYYGYGTDKVINPDKVVSLDDAWRDIANFKNTQQVIDLSYRNKVREESEIKENLQRWMQTGLLSKLAFDFLSDNIGKRPKHEILSKAAKIIQGNVVKVRDYQGPGVDHEVKKVASSKEIAQELKNMEIQSKKEEQRFSKLIQDRKRSGLLKYIGDMKNKGILKEASAEKLSQLCTVTNDLKKAFDLSMSLIRMEMNGPHRPEMKEITKEAYDGEGIGAVPQLDMTLEDAVNEVEYAEELPGFSLPEIAKAGDKITDLMNKGLSGKALADAIGQAGLDQIVDYVPILSANLQMNDGVIGVLFLDPEIYFTQNLDGCKAAAKKLKKSPVQNILEKPKCVKCTQNRGDFCNVYGRKLVKPDFEEILRSRSKKSPEKLVPYVAELDPSLVDDWNTDLD
jgi:hypothetical protein